MSDKRKFVASSELFSNFEYEISLYSISSIDDIFKQFKKAMMDIFIENNFSVLQKKLEETEFHIHGKTIEEILTSDPEDIFFICDHT
jgi:hypothetical protein